MERVLRLVSQHLVSILPSRLTFCSFATGKIELDFELHRGLPRDGSLVAQLTRSIGIKDCDGQG